MVELKIRFITTRGFVSWAIRRVTFSEFSHVEIELPDGTFLGAHAGDGVQIRATDYCTPLFERRYSLLIPEVRYQVGMEFARSKIGTQYNLPDIVGLFFHSHLTSPGKLICSQFVFEVLLEMGIKALNVLGPYSYLVTPDSLHLSPIFIGKCYFQTERPK